MRLWWRGRVRRLQVFRVHRVRAAVAMQQQVLRLVWRVVQSVVQWVRQRVLLARMLPRAQQLRMRQLLAVQWVRLVEVVQQQVDAVGQAARLAQVDLVGDRCALACLRA
jgi:hypothetical protein